MLPLIAAVFSTARTLANFFGFFSSVACCIRRTRSGNSNLPCDSGGAFGILLPRVPHFVGVSAGLLEVYGFKPRLLRFLLRFFSQVMCSLSFLYKSTVPY